MGRGAVGGGGGRVNPSKPEKVDEARMRYMTKGEENRKMYVITDLSLPHVAISDAE